MAKRGRHCQAPDDQQTDEDQRNFPTVKDSDPDQQVQHHDVRDEFVIHAAPREDSPYSNDARRGVYVRRGEPNSVRVPKDRPSDADLRYATGDRGGDGAQFGLHTSGNE